MLRHSPAVCSSMSAGEPASHPPDRSPANVEVTTAPGFAEDGVMLSQIATSVATGLAGMPRLAGWVVIGPFETGRVVVDGALAFGPLVDELQADSAVSAIATLNRFEVSTHPGCPIREAVVESRTAVRYERTDRNDSQRGRRRHGGVRSIYPGGDQWLPVGSSHCISSSPGRSSR